MIATTATVTKTVREDVVSKLDMVGCELIYVSPNRSNICYKVASRTLVEEHLTYLIEQLRIKRNKAERVIIYCRSLNMCAYLYAHFLDSLGSNSYYPPGAQEISDNRLFGMYHADTPKHNKEVIQKGMLMADGTVRVVFASMALGMGVNFLDLNVILHYGAPSSIEDYFQESGRAGRSGELATSTIFWKPQDAPLRKDLSDPRAVEVAAVRKYLEDKDTCRRVQLLRYFDSALLCSLTL